MVVHAYKHLESIGKRIGWHQALAQGAKALCINPCSEKETEKNKTKQNKCPLIITGNVFS
jgi:hypothetical protein